MCIGEYTLNEKEWYHSKIWKVCPKSGFYGKIIVEIGTNDTVIVFNEGMAGRL